MVFTGLGTTPSQSPVLTGLIKYQNKTILTQKICLLVSWKTRRRLQILHGPHAALSCHKLQHILDFLRRGNSSFPLDFGFVTSQAPLSGPTRRSHSHCLAPLQGVCFRVVDTTILTGHQEQSVHVISFKPNSPTRKTVFSFHG